MGRGDSPSLDRAVTELSKLPGIGPRMAQRLAYSLLRRPTVDVENLSQALRDLVSKVRHCSLCGYYSETDPCHICTSQERDTRVVCVVEQPQDVFAIERSGGYKGLYHVLGGVLSPIDGIGPDEIRIKSLLERLRGDIHEVIIATNPTVGGDATALYLQVVIEPIGIGVSRLARGLPTGGDLEFADEMTLSSAISMRTKL